MFATVKTNLGEILELRQDLDYFRSRPLESKGIEGNGNVARPQRGSRRRRGLAARWGFLSLL